MGRASACCLLVWIIFCARESLGLHLSRLPAGTIWSPINTPVSSLKCTAACNSNCTVQWLRTTDESDTTNATALSVTDNYWHSTYNISYSSYTYQERNRYETEVQIALAIYKFTSAYAGTYFCRAVEGKASVESKHIHLQVLRMGSRKEGTTSSVPPASPSCYPQAIDNFLVNKSAESNRTSLCVDVYWSFRSNKSCNGSYIDLLLAEWDRAKDIPEIDFSDNDTSSAIFVWTHLLSIPITNRSAHICGLDYQKYYEFQLRVSSEQNNDTAKFLSHIYRFGLQVPARVIWAPKRVFQKAGTSFILPCKVDGIPASKVYWLRTLTGKHRLGSGRSGTTEHSPVYHFQHVPVVHEWMTGIYQCVASNKIVNPPSGVHNVVDTWHMSITVL